MPSSLDSEVCTRLFQTKSLLLVIERHSALPTIKQYTSRSVNTVFKPERCCQETAALLLPKWLPNMHSYHIMAELPGGFLLPEQHSQADLSYHSKIFRGSAAQSAALVGGVLLLPPHFSANS